MTQTLRVSEGHQGSTSEVNLDQERVADARTWFYPAWWTHIGTPRKSAPLYRVHCSNEDEVALARTLKPDFIDAEYILIE